MGPGVDLRDQGFLPGPPLQLPGPEPSRIASADEGGEARREERATPARSLSEPPFLGLVLELQGHHQRP